MPELVRLVVGTAPTSDFGRVLDTWTEYQWTEGLFNGSNNGSFRLALTARGQGAGKPSEAYIKRACELTVPDTVVRLEIGEEHALLATGIIVDQTIDGDDRDEWISVDVSDPATVLMSNEVDVKMAVKGKTLPQIADQILEPYRGKGLQLKVLSTYDANRDILTGKRANVSAQKTIRTSNGTAQVKIANEPNTGFVKATIPDARPHPGETQWDFLSRHAANLGVLMAFSAEGNLIFCSPDYNQDAIYNLYRYRDESSKHLNTILRGGRKLSSNGTATSVHILGRGSLYRSKDPNVKKTRRHKVKPKIQATAKTDRSFIWPRQRYVRDSHPKDNAAALKLAQRELAHRNANAEVYEYTLKDHQSARGVRYTVNTIAKLVDELPRPKVDKNVWLTTRMIRKSEQGTFTSITAVPVGAIVL